MPTNNIEEAVVKTPKKEWAKPEKKAVAVKQLLPSEKELIADLNQQIKNQVGQSFAKLYPQSEELSIGFQEGLLGKNVTPGALVALLDKQGISYTCQQLSQQENPKINFMVKGEAAITKLAVLGLEFNGAEPLRKEQAALQTTQSAFLQ